MAFPGRVHDDARFNSIFRDPPDTAAGLAQLRAWHGPGELVVVTHQVNITALTGVVLAAGEAVIVAPTDGGITTVGRLAP